MIMFFSRPLTGSTAGAASCTVCGAGKYLSDTGTIATAHDAESDCEICGADSYSSTAGAASCTFCGAGRYLRDAGITVTAHDD